MPFTVRDLSSLARALEKRPEWKAELRRLLLTEEVLSLPEVVRRIADQVEALVEAQRRAEGRVGRLEGAVEALVEAQRRTEDRVGRLEGAVEALVEAQRRTEDRVGRLEGAVEALVEAQRRTEQEVGQMAREMGRLTVEVGALKGSDLERRYREQAASLFQALVRRIQLVSHQDLGNLLDDAVDVGRISVDEKAEILRADVVVSGRRDDRPVYVLAEVSVVVDQADVERAAHRAALLEKATGTPILAVVAGQRILAEAEESARATGVWRVVDGLAQPPA